MNKKRETFKVFGEYGELTVDLPTGAATGYEPADKANPNYSNITRFDIPTYEMTFGHRILAGDRIDIAHFDYWSTVGIDGVKYHKRTKMSTDPKPMSMKDSVEAFSKEIESIFHVINHTGKRTLEQFFLLVKEFQAPVLSVDYDYTFHCWVLSAVASEFEPVKRIEMHQFAMFDHSDWLSDIDNERYVTHLVNVAGLRPIKGLGTKAALIKFLAFGEFAFKSRGVEQWEPQ